MSVLTEPYHAAGDEELLNRIRETKDALGDRLLILGHHYQRQEIMEIADLHGDSLGLSRSAASRTDCRFIVFCGVRFMAESAEILRQAHQRVQHPDPSAGCPMADMAEIVDVERAWGIIAGKGGRGKVVPVTYMNSSSEIKALCGRMGGTVCTSSNAEAAFRWALDRGEQIFFLPDEHLGRNTARRVGIPEEEILVWDPAHSPDAPGMRSRLRAATLVLWKGFCNIHTRFQPDHIRQVRERFPDARIVVHPECTTQVVEQADAVGSTEFICRYVEACEPGSTVFVGTEINLVNRLSRAYPDRKVYELARSLCPNMFRISLAKVLWTLENIGEANRVRVEPEMKRHARTALERMLEMTPVHRPAAQPPQPPHMPCAT